MQRRRHFLLKRTVRPVALSATCREPRIAGSTAYLQERGGSGAGSCCLLRENQFTEKKAPLLGGVRTGS